MQLDDSIFVAGHRGMVGSAVVRRLSEAAFGKILTRSRAELDLLDRAAVRAFFDQERPSVVVDAAAKVGGIVANNEQPVEFLLQNVAIQNNLIEAAADFGTRKLLFLGSSCIYPKMASQPISESALLTGPLEVTNEAYAQGQQINILTKSGELLDIAQASDLPNIKVISKIVKKNYLCWPKDVSL